MNKQYFITFDIEEWYHSNFKSLQYDKESNFGNDIEYETDILLELCDSLNIKSTCFILGCVAEKYPDMVKKIYQNGHEIASHGYCHKLVYEMSEYEFKEDIYKSKAILENVIGDNIYGFRAPSWSVKEQNLSWFYRTLLEEGFTYSSSIYPAYTYLYGIKNAPKHPFRYKIGNASIVEIPVPVTKLLGKTIGYTGGFYLRLFPFWFIKSRLKKISNDFFIYLHPREITEIKDKMKLNILESIIAYYGVNSCRKKLEKLMQYLSTSSYTNTRICDYVLHQSDNIVVEEINEYC